MIGLHPTPDNRERRIESSGVLVAVTILLAVFSPACKGQPSEPALRGNVILISIDTLRADHLSCYGYHRHTSPFIDSLAARGTLFENAIVQVPGTLPSHMSMLTGLLPAEHGVMPPEGVLPLEIPLLQELLSTAGVRTGGFTEGGYVAGRFGFSRGFEQFDDTADKLNTDIEDVFWKGLEFLRELGPEQRFFLFLHSYAVHDPYFPPPPYTDAFLLNIRAPLTDGFERFSHDDLTGPTPENVERQKALFRNTVDFVRTNLPAGAALPTGPELVKINRGVSPLPSSETIEYYRALYDATILYVDDAIAAFVDGISQLGFSDNTVVIITSDHGEEFLEHGRLTHEQVYHECLHVPLIIVGPNIEAGRRVSDLVMSIDLTPTVLELLRVDHEVTFSGDSLTPYLVSGHPTPRARDAHAIGSVDPSEALYRRQGDVVHQLVVHKPTARKETAWLGQSAVLEVAGREVSFEARSFAQPRTLTVTGNGAESVVLPMTPSWQLFRVQLGDSGGKRLIELASDTCDRPIDLGQSEDSRCLSFQLRGQPGSRIEFFSISDENSPHLDVSLSSSPQLLLTELLSGLSKFQRERVATTSSSPLDEATRSRLKELGYLQ